MGLPLPQLAISKLCFEKGDYARSLIQRWLWGSSSRPRSARPYTATHHPHRAFGTVGNTDDTSPDARAVQNGQGKLMALLQPFRFLGIALYGFFQ